MSARWSLPGLTVALVLAGAAALLLTPEPGYTPSSGMAGWPRLVLYALAGTILALTAAAECLRRVRPLRSVRRAWLLVGVGVAASLVVALVNARRLQLTIADPIGPALWLISMALILIYTLFPLARRVGWLPLWPEPDKVTRWGWLAPLLVVGVAAAIRLPRLAAIPQGINPDEGDRASTAMDVLNGLAPASWFDSGWFFINMIYFRVLALSMQIFGTDVFGGRMLTALAGIAFVGAIAWIGWRNFGRRIGLVAAAFATGMHMTVQHSRLITEAGPTALLWAISIGGFLEGARSGRPWAWVLAGLSGGLSLYFYPSARLWAVGAALTCLLVLAFVRDRRVLAGILLAALASVVAALPFLVHLSQHPDEVSGRYAQTAVVDPRNQERLAYLTPPEPLPELAALQVERTIGMFDRYPDGGGFLPNGRPVFGAPLAQLALVGIFYLTVRGWRDLRLAVLSAWFWVGLSGVALTVETPDYLRSVGMLPSLCFVFAVLLVDIVDRVLPQLVTMRREVYAGAVPAVLATLLLVPEVVSYFATFRTLPSGWAPETHEGQVIAAMGASGPVYSLEMNEHMVSSGWVRLLSPHTERGRMPNPGRELPVVTPVGPPVGPLEARPGFYPADGQGFGVLMSPDPNQRPYIPLLQALYPAAVVGDGGGDQRQSVEVSPAALSAIDGVTLVDAAGVSRRVDGFGQVPPGVALPADLTWHAGIRFPTGGVYTFATSGPPDLMLRVDGISIRDGERDVLAAAGLHFVEVSARPRTNTDAVQLMVDGAELTPQQTYRLMDAPWGLLARLGRLPGDIQHAHLDATVAMAFFDPELGAVLAPDTLTWSGWLVAPRSGTYRMALASEDRIRLQLDGQPVNVVTVRPEDWQSFGTGSMLELAAGTHRVEVTLEISHGGRDLARWNWVPPLASGGVDTATAWSVVPPSALRPDPPISVAETAARERPMDR